MKDAKPSQGSDYMRAGHYWALVKKCKCGTTRKNNGFYANELEILRVLDDANGVGHKDNEEVTHMVMAGDMFLGDVKQFICAILGYQPDDVDEDICMDVTKMDGEDAQPLKWMVVEVKGKEQPTKAGGIFTKISYQREVPLDEVLEKCEEKTIEKAFPDEVLASLLEASAAE